mgnify:FL=1
MDAVNWYRKQRGKTGSVLFIDLPETLVEKYRLINLPETHPARAFSAIPEEEFLLPGELASRGTPYSGFVPSQKARRAFYEERRFPSGPGFKKRPFVNNE